MPQYRKDAREADYLRLKAAMLELARSGQFDTNDALVYASSRGLMMNAGDVAAIVAISLTSASFGELDEPKQLVLNGSSSLNRSGERRFKSCDPD